MADTTLIRKYASDLLSAADSLDQAASLGNAVQERKAAIASIDAQIADKKSELSGLADQADAMRASMDKANADFAALDASRRAALEQEIGQSRTALESQIASDKAAHEDAMSQLQSTRNDIAQEVESLRRQRDVLAGEVEAFKNRLATL